MHSLQKLGTEGDIALHFLLIKLQSKVGSEVTKLIRVGSRKKTHVGEARLLHS